MPSDSVFWFAMLPIIWLGLFCIVAILVETFGPRNRRGRW